MRYPFISRKLAVPLAFIVLALLIPANRAIAQSQDSKADPCLAANPNPLQFFVNACDTFPTAATQYLYITNCGGGTLEWTINDPGWFDFDKTSGIGNDSIAVNIKPDTLEYLIDSLQPFYYDTIFISITASIEASGAVNSPIMMVYEIYLYCAGNETILATEPTSFQFNLNAGDSVIGESLYVYEINGQSIGFWVSNGMNYWLEVDTMAASPLITPELIFLNIRTSSLSSGVYFDTVYIDSYDGANTPLMIPVTLTVGGGDSTYFVETWPTGYNFTIAPGEVERDSLYVYEIYGRSVPFAFSHSSIWLNVQPDSMWSYYTPGSLEIIVTDSGLDVGSTYVDTIVIEPAVDSFPFPPVLVPVSVTVTEPVPVWVASPDHFEFMLDQGDSLTNQGFVVYLENGDELYFTVVSALASSWLELPPPQEYYTTPDSVFFNINTNGLDFGAYSDTICIVDADAWIDTFLKVPVTLTIDSAGYVLVVEPSSLEYYAGQNDTIFDILYVSELHRQNILFDYSNNSNWLYLPMYLAPLTTPDSIWFTISTYGLESGTYYDTIVVRGFTDPAAAPVHVVCVPVTLTVGDSACVIAAMPTWFNYTLNQGDSVIGESLYVYETQGQSINFWTYNYSYWLEVDTMAVTPLYTPKTIFFNVRTERLAPGIYSDTIVIIAYDASNSPLLIPVSIIVEGDYDYIVETEPDWFYIHLMPGEVRYDSLYVYEKSGASIPFIFFDYEPWLTVYDPLPEPPYTNTTPMSLVVMTDASSLTPGTYIDTIVIEPDTSYISTLFPAVAVPVMLIVQSSMPVVKTLPDHFELTLNQGDTLTNIGMLVYEENGDTVMFITETLPGSSWLRLHTPDTSLYMEQYTPDSVYFDIYTDRLVPGIYADTIVIYNPLDDTLWYIDVKVPVVLRVEGEQPDYIIETSPTSFDFTLNQGEFMHASLYVYEVYDRSINFLCYNQSNWLHTNLRAPQPYTTPLSLPLILDADSLAPGVYIDSIFIYSGADSAKFPPVVVPAVLKVEEGSVCGDMDQNGAVNLLDITYLINFLYKGGPPANPMDIGDTDGNGTINLLDVIYVIDFLYRFGAKPLCPAK